MNADPRRLQDRVRELSEFNPMLGFRGVRLAITYPEIAEMQARAIFEAAAVAGKRTGKPVMAEVMVPLIATKAELDMIKARVEAKRGSLGCGAPCYTAALTALGGTWIANLDSTNRDNGVYVIYSTAPGDILNGASFGGDRNYYVHPSIDSIPGVAQDDRYRRKVALSTSACGTNYTSPLTEVKVTATHRACTYATNVTPIPTIRNEDLVLLRAEADWFTGATAAALADLASVRAGSGATRGGTAVVKFVTPAVDSEFVAEVLLQRTLSLYQEA